jgi:F-type H+-transporting ATPase subunit delta
MALKGVIARRYAEAVFDIARQQNAIDRWRSDIAFLRELLTNRRLVFVLSEPKVAFETKRAILTDLAGSRVQPDALGMALLIVEDGLVELMPNIAREFDRLYDDYYNRAEATITTALPLDQGERASLEAHLRQITGKNIILTTQVDSTILGGIIARVGDTLIDGSLRRRLDVLRDRIVSGG